MLRTAIIATSTAGLVSGCFLIPTSEPESTHEGPEVPQLVGSGASAEAQVATEVSPPAAAPAAPVVRGSVVTPPGVLAPAMADQYVTGTAGGSDAASAFGEGCVGWLPEAPSMLLTVTAPMRALVQVTRALNSDLTLVISGDDDVFCDDDSGAGFQPRLEPTLMPGEYRVYVGTYDAQGAGAYTLQIGEAAPPAAPPACDGPDAVVLSPNAARVERRGHTSGDRMCSSMFVSAECQGFYGGSVGHCLRVTETTRVVVDVTEASFDSTVAIRRIGAPGVTINDDRSGNDLRSRLAMTLEPGDYEVHVGALEPGQGGDYAIDVYPGPEPLAAQPAPSGCIPLEIGRPLRIDGRLAGIMPCTDRLGFTCDGYVSQAPNHCFHVQGPSAARFAIVSSDADTLLHLRGPGVLASDDNGGTGALSAVTATVTTGDYEVFVGSYDQRITGPYVLEVERYR